MWILSRNLMVGLVVPLLAYGCGSGNDSGAAARAQAARAAAKRHAKPADALVSAVAASKTVTLPVQVKFDLHTRPDVGQPVDVDLVILPTSAAIDRVSGKITGDEGLEVVDGGLIPASEHPAEGVEIHHPFRVMPKRDGIFTFSAALTVDSGVRSQTQTYSMPLIAGTGMPEAPPKPPGTTTATTAVAAPASAPTAPASLPPTAAATTARASTPATATAPR
jgi:hypothetical protein